MVEIKDILEEVEKVNLEPLVTPLLKVLDPVMGSLPKGTVQSLMKSLEPVLASKEMQDSLAKLVEGLAPALPSLIKMIGSISESMPEIGELKLPAISVGLGLGGGTLATVDVNLPSIPGLLSSLMGAVGPLLTPLISSLMPLIKSLLPILLKLIAPLASLLPTLLPLLKEIMKPEVLGSLVSTVSSLVPTLSGLLKTLDLPKLMGMLTGTLKAISG